MSSTSKTWKVAIIEGSMVLLCVLLAAASEVPIFCYRRLKPGRNMHEFGDLALFLLPEETIRDKGQKRP